MYEDIISKELKLWQPKLEKLALDIWANPEKPNAEYKACKWTADLLREAGFEVEEGVAGLSTAIRASYGSGKPVYGLLGEYDALPNLSQKVSTQCESAEPGRCYMFGDGQSTITINLIPEYDLDTVAAIVIHECMHHYLNVRKMRFKDQFENEILTDTCAIYCGFGEIMYKGYGPRSIYYKGQRKLQKHGYLSQNEIKYIMRKV